MSKTTMLRTNSTAFSRFRTTNSTDASFPSRVPVNARPSGAGNAAAQTTSAVLDLGIDKFGNGDSTQNAIIIVPFGTGSDTNTFLMRLIGWRVVGGDAPLTQLWIPVPIVDLTCTLSTPVGVAGMIIDANNRFCDTLAIANTIGTNGVSVDVCSNGANLIAHAVIDMKGFQLVEATFDRNSSASSCNSLWAYY